MPDSTSSTPEIPVSVVDLSAEQRAYQVQQVLANQSMGGTQSSPEEKAAFAQYITGEKTIEDLLEDAAKFKDDLIAKAKANKSK